MSKLNRTNKRVPNSKDITYIAIIVDCSGYSCPKLLELIKDLDEPTDYKIIFASEEDNNCVEIPSFEKLGLVEGVKSNHDLVERLVRWCEEEEFEYELFGSWEQVGNSDFSEIEEFHAKQDLRPYGFES